jgi:hypothetical protein
MAVVLEQIDWHYADDVQPDSGMLVLMYCPEASEPVWIGYLDEDCWRYSDASQCEEDVLFWAEMPHGPAQRSPVASDSLFDRFIEAILRQRFAAEAAS